jgi:hypothetical protein
MFLKKREGDMADSELLKNALAGLIDRLEKTEKFVLEQAPDVCQQVVMEFKIHNFMQMGFAAVAFLFGLVAVPVAIAHPMFVVPEGHYSSDPTWYMGLFIVGGVGLVAGFCVLVNTVYWNIYVNRCTKLFLLREFKRLVK